MRTRHFVLFLVLILFINAQCALYERVKNAAGETREEVADSASENYHKGKNYVGEKLEEAGDTVKEMYHRVRDASSEKLEDIADAVGDTYEKVKNVGQRIIGRGSDTVGEKLSQGKEAVRDSYYTGKRKFNKYTNILEDVYYIGWDKLDRMYRNGKLSLLDFKDFLGDKYDDFVDYIGLKGKEITPKSSRRVRDIYELLWDNIDELVSNGKLNADQIKDFFGDKYEEVKEKGKEALDVDSKDLERWKNTLLNWKKGLFKPEEKTTWWTNFMGKFTDMKNSLKESVGMETDRGKDFGDYGWEVLNSLISSKKLKIDDLRDILGDNFDSVSDFLKKGNFDKISKSVGNNVNWLRDHFHDLIGDLFEGDAFNLDYLYEVLVGFIPDDGLAGKSKKEITKDIDNLKETIIQLKEKFIGESHPKTYWERFKDKIGSVTDSAKEKLGITTKSRPRRIFDKATSKLENLYNIGWDKLDYFFKNGKLGLEDFKDLLGDKYEEVFNFITEKLEVGKEGIEDVMHHGKRILKSPERLRDIYELVWDYVDEQYRKGSIGFEQIKDLIGDNFDDVADSVISGIDKGKDVIKSATGSDQFDVELDRLKRKILEMKNTLSEHTEGGFWANFVNMINNFKNRAFGTNKERQPAGRSEWSHSRNRDKNQDTSSTEL